MSEKGKMMSNPKKCGKATWIDGTPICRLKLLPCYTMEECALTEQEKLLDIMRELIKGERKYDE